MVTFWSFRMMIGLGTVSVGVGAVILWLSRRDRLITARPWARVALWTMPLPFIAASFGWIFTEMGRQPGVVVPNLADPTSMVHMLTADGVSRVVSSATVLASMVVFTLLYAGLGVVWLLLFRRYVREGVRTPVRKDDGEVAPGLSFAY